MALDTSGITLPTANTPQNLPEANQGYLDQINKALQSDTYGQYLITHANNGDQDSLKQLYALAQKKGFQIPDNATFASGYFQNSGGSGPAGMAKIMVPAMAAAIGAPYLAPLLMGGGGAAAAGAGGAAAGGADAGASALPFFSTASSLTPFGTAGVTGAADVAGGLGLGAGAGGAAAAGAGAKAAGVLTKADVLSKLGAGVTSITSGAAAGRAAEATANQNQFATQIKGLQAQIDRAKVAKSLQEQDYADQLRGQLLANMQDFKYTPPPQLAGHTGTFSGGLKLSAMPDRVNLGNNITNAATLDLLQKGDPNTGYTGASTAPMPTLPPLPTPNAGQQFLSYLGPGLNLAGLLKQWQGAK